VFDFLKLERVQVDSSETANKTLIISEKEKTLRKRYRQLIKPIPLPIKKLGRGLINKTYNVNKENLTKDQKDQIYKLLKSDMREFSKEYAFDTSKWGF
jgi:hypothetical protein